MKNFPNLRLKITQSTMDVGLSLKETLSAAKEQGRLTFGVYESGKMLETNPDNVMLCVLPENSSHDVTLQIHYTLIEAFCWENDIRLLKVDSVKKLAEIITESPIRPPVNDNDVSRLADDVESDVTNTDNGNQNEAPSYTSSDFNCVLLQYPTTECSEAEEQVLEFCRITSDFAPLPIVPLSV